MAGKTTYNKNYLKRAEKYLQDKINSTKDPIPWIEELAEELGVSDTTIDNWRKAHEDFNDVYLRLHRRQKFMLQKMGMSRKVATPMTIFLLKANHGMIETEKRISEVSGRDGGPITISDVLDQLDDR